MKYKICNKCNKKKAITEFYERFDKRYNKIRVSNSCIECEQYGFKRISKKELKQKREKEKKQGLKQCSLCNQTKSLENFYFRDSDNCYRNECKECTNKNVTESYNKLENIKKRKDEVKRKKKEREIKKEIKTQELLSRETKICSNCKKEKFISEFHSNKTSRDKLSLWCKDCDNQYSKKYYKENRKELLEDKKIYSKKRYKKNRKKILKKQKLDRKKNPERYKKYYKTKREKNKDIPLTGKELKYRRNYVKKRRKESKYKELEKGWSKKNREKNKDNPQYQLNDRMRHGIRASLNGQKKGDTWESLVDYNFKELYNHFESLFTDGMNWDEFLKGEIHLDHIIPQCYWQYEKPEDEEFYHCWKLENIQPLWATTRIINGKKYIGNNNKSGKVDPILLNQIVPKHIREKRKNNIK
jgi:hypothetical protein